MASIREPEQNRHSTSKHGYVETLRTVTKDDSEQHAIAPRRTAGAASRNFWLTYEDNEIIFV